MPTTFTPGDERQDEKLNPGQQDYDRRFNDIVNAERDAAAFNDIADNYDKTASGDQEDANIKAAREQEAASATGAGWANRVDTPQAKTKRNVKGWFKKAGPALGIGGIFGIGGFVIIGLMSPGLLIVQMKEMMVEKFNTSLASSEARSTKLIRAKMDSQTTGVCTTVLTVKCKFATMSEKQVKKFADAGIMVDEGSKQTFFGRTKPASFTFEGNKINAADFASTARTNPNFASALRKAYNPAFHAFSGRAWSAVATKFKISKQTPDINGSEGKEKAKARLQAIATEGISADNVDIASVKAGDQKDPNCTGDCAKWTADEIEEARGKAQSLGADGESGKSGSDVKNRLASLNVGSITEPAINIVKATGVVDTACAAYGAMASLTYAAKAIRAAQLVRYSMVFMGVADSIKAGVSPNPDDVAYLGGLLTAVSVNSTNPAEKVMGSATDSFGYKYAAYGDASSSTKSMNIANRFMAGGGMVGELSSFSSSIMNFFPGGRNEARKTCGVLANPVVQVGSVLAGIAMLFVPGANIGKTLASAAISVAVGVGIAMVPQLLADIVAGSVTDDIQGEETGNAITSGAGSLMSDSLAAQNGNAPMTKDDAIAYNSLQTHTTNEYIASTTSGLSPLDATSRHTFLGTISSNLMNLQSSSNPVSFVGALVSSSLSSLTPKSKAQSTDEYAKSLDVCTDMDAVDAGYAVDPFCNIIRGIPQKYLDKDINTVIDQMIQSGSINEDGSTIPGSTYESFVKKCMTSSEPLGYSEGTEFNTDEAKECIINDSNANFYLYFNDARIERGMSDEDVADANAPAAPSASGAYVLPTNPGYGYPNHNQDWGPRSTATAFHRGVDISGGNGGGIGKPVFAIADGTVTLATLGNTSCAVTTNTSKAGNNVVEIKHADGTVSGYWHMASQDITVRAGDTVKAGQQIGAVNKCGYTQGAHLHFTMSAGSATDPAITSIEKNGEFINPVEYLRLRGVDIMRGAYTDGR